MGFEEVKLPPHSIEAERCLLASMMLDREAIDSMGGIVGRDSFYQPDHQIIYETIVAIHREGRPVDAVILREELNKRGLLVEIGGSAYIGTILASVPSAAHIKEYAAAVRETHLRRQAIKAANDVLRSAYDPHGKDADCVVQGGASAFANILGQSSGIHIRSLESVLHDVWSDLEQGGVPSVPTGYRGLDDRLSGLVNGEMIVIAARPSMGKSALGKELIRQIAGGSVPCGLISVEEKEKKVGRNMLASESGVENNRIRSGNIRSDEMDRFKSAFVRSTKLPLWIDDKSYTLSQVIASATCMKSQYGCRAVFIDYLQLIDAEMDSRNANDTAKVSHVSKEIKRTAKRLDIPIVILAQLNRSNESVGIRRPKLSDLRQSGQIEQDADVVILLHREDYYHRNEMSYEPNHCMEAIVAKLRDGPAGTVLLHYNETTQRISDWIENIPDYLQASEN